MLFQKYGEIERIEIPLRKGGKGQAMGIAFINFKETEAAITAYANLDQEYYQGRKLHIMPAQDKPPPSEDQIKRETDAAGNRDNKLTQKTKSTDFKDDKQIILKTNFDDETNWNYLYMN